VGLEGIDDGFVVHPAPEVVVERACFFGKLECGDGVFSGGVDFKFVADDARVEQDLFEFFVGHVGDFLNVEVVKKCLVSLAFLENGDP